MEHKEEKNMENFGKRVFNDSVMKERLSPAVYKSIKNTIENRKEIDPRIADEVAQAMKEWAIGLGATHYTHWFQPLSGVTAEKHDAFLTPLSHSEAIFEFSGKELIKGESDASSFPSGGLRATFEARGYTAWDPASYAYVRDGSLYIPTVFCSYTGEALDCKTPLLRSMDVLSSEATRILRLFGDEETTCVNASVGAEQEYFLIDEKAFDSREDLLYTGRTLFGAPAPKGQQLDDHYYGPLKMRVSEFMRDLDEELWELGIPSKTKHNEAAPSQHELAPVYTGVSVAVDQNLLMMETMKRVARRHGMACLLHEKPFEGMNGSGKHNNWSIATNTGKNLLKPGSTPSENTQFLLFLAAIVKAVDDYQDLLRLSIASASNDHRLGSNEAPPAIISIFLGEDLEKIISDIISGVTPTSGKRSMMDLHTKAIPVFARDTTDRNRTSPFAFTGNKFEFRMVGSSQNLSLSSMVLNTTVAYVLGEFADILENEKDFQKAVSSLIKDTFTKHQRIIFNGNGYSEEWEKEAEKRGLANYKSTVDVIPHFVDDKNVQLFTKTGVMSKTEMLSRMEIFFENYEKVIGIEARTMVDMANKDYIPAVNAYIESLLKICKEKTYIGMKIGTMESETIKSLSNKNERAYLKSNELKKALVEASTIQDTELRANTYNKKVLPLMEDLRKSVDEMEEETSREYWPVLSYGDLTFSVK